MKKEILKNQQKFVQPFLEMNFLEITILKALSQNHQLMQTKKKKSVDQKKKNE
jgi:hypothetical protein